MSDRVQFIHHTCRREEWREAETAGSYHGSSRELRDGFVHFSAAAQVAENAPRRRAGQDGLVLLTVDATQLGALLEGEPACGGQLFPRLYGAPPPDTVVSANDLPPGADGRHIIPALR